MNDPIRLAGILKVLSTPARVRIVQLLKRRALCVNALAARANITQSAVSQHLRIMRNAGIVVDEKRGYFVHYRLNEQVLAGWQGHVGELLDPKTGAGENTKGAGTCAVAMTRSRTAGNRRT